MERANKAYPTHKTPKKGMRYSGGNYIYQIYNSGSRKLNRFTKVEIFLLAFFAGGFMCVASLLAASLSSGATQPGSFYLLSALGLSIGLFLIVLTNAAVFSEANIFIRNNFYGISMGQGCLRLLRFWLLTWFGNILGVFFFAFIISLAQQYPETLQQNLVNLTTMKLQNKNILALFLSGMLANWIIALASFFAVASRNFINQFIIIFLAFILIAASNFQYFLINASYFALNYFMAKGISLSDAIFFNLIPVSLGNLLGAALLVAGPLLYFSKKYPSPK